MHFLQVTTYSGTTTTHTLTIADDSIIAGQIYMLKSLASNEFGNSDYSEEVTIGLSSYPAAPATLTKNEADSGSTYITLEWAASADTEMPVLGYVLSQMDNSLGTGAYT